MLAMTRLPDNFSAEFFAAEEMEMEVGDFLASIRARIADDAESAFKHAYGFGDFRNGGE